MTIRIITADVMEGLAQLADDSVHCVVTSPPYWGLRSYLPADHPRKGDEIGSEPTLAEHIARLVAVFREVRRVLRPDGTLWLNYGDMWASAGGAGWQGKNGQRATRAVTKANHMGRTARDGLKPKDLCMAPHRLAIALQDDGWWVRSDIVWHKPNPMPSSVTDRPTPAKEFVFLLSKSARYAYDAAAIAERRTSLEDAHEFRGGSYVGGEPGPRKVRGNKRIKVPGGWDECEQEGAASLTRNARDVWTIASEPFKEAHYATFPQELAHRCIAAGTSAKGCCRSCGAPWRRLTETEYINPGNRTTNGPRSTDRRAETPGFARRLEKLVTTTGWERACQCADHGPVPCIVLDPFGGSGTVGLVADQLQRHAILIDIDERNRGMSERRVMNDAPLLAEIT